MYLTSHSNGCACARARSHARNRVHVYNKVLRPLSATKRTLTVKILLIFELFQENIWWNGK